MKALLQKINENRKLRLACICIPLVVMFFVCAGFVVSQSADISRLKKQEAAYTQQLAQVGFCIRERGKRCVDTPEYIEQDEFYKKSTTEDQGGFVPEISIHEWTVVDLQAANIGIYQNKICHFGNSFWQLLLFLVKIFGRMHLHRTNE